MTILSYVDYLVNFTSDVIFDACPYAAAAAAAAKKKQSATDSSAAGARGAGWTKNPSMSPIE